MQPPENQPRGMFKQMAQFAATLALLCCCAAACAEGPITYSDTVRQDPNERIYVAKIDLTDPKVSVVVAAGGPDPDGPGPWETVLRQPSEIAKTLNLDLAVNAVFFSHLARDGDAHHYFAGEPAKGMNPVMADGKFMTTAHAGLALMIDGKDHATIGTVPNPPPPGATLIVGGSDQVLTAGKITAGEDARAPRTSAGVTADGKTLILLVVDGRRDDWSAGFTLKELAAEMKAQGCQDAINLDGGGSSTMVRKLPNGRFKVINTPSDGATLMLPLSVERPVAYTLGVRVAAK